MLRTIIKTHSAKYKFMLVAALLPLLVFAGTSDLPDFADSAGSVISPEYERRLGQMFLKQVRYEYAQAFPGQPKRIVIDYADAEDLDRLIGLLEE